MNIAWDLKEFNFDGPFEGTREYIEGKLEKVKRYIGSLAKDEEMSFRVSIFREETRNEEERYFMKVVITLPGKKLLEADLRGYTPEECVDKIEDKLRAQVENLKRF